MGCGALSKQGSKESNIARNGLQSILPEEIAVTNQKKEPAKQIVIKPSQQIILALANGVNERTDVSNDLPPLSSSPFAGPEVVSREVNFTSGLIFTEALPNRPDLNTTLDSSLIFRMIKKGELQAFKDFIAQFYKQQTSQYHQIHTIKGMWNSSPLMVAIQYNQKEMIDYLLTLLPVHNQSKSSLFCESDEVKSFTRKILNEKNEKGATIFHYATVERLSLLLQQLFSEPFLSNISKDSLLTPSIDPIYNAMYDQSIICSPFSIAIMNGYLEILKLFIRINVCPITDAFPFAVMKSYKKKLMLNSENCNYNKSGGNGTTPLFLAVSYGQLLIVKEILAVFQQEKRGLVFDLLAAKDNDGCNVFHYLSRLTMKQQAVSEQQDLTLETHLNAMNVNVLIFKELRQVCGIDVSLLNSRDSTGNTPLLLACEQKQVELIRVLLEEGADPSLFNELTALAPLHVAVKKRSIEMVTCLLEFGADPTAKLLSTVTSQSAYEMCSKQLKSNHEIYQLIENAAIAWNAIRNKNMQIEVSHEQSSLDPKDLSTPAFESSIEEKENEVHAFTSVKEENPIHSNSQDPQPSIIIEKIESSLLTESFLSEKCESCFVDAVDPQYAEDEELFSVTSSNCIEERSPHNPIDPPQLSQLLSADKENFVISPIQAYMNTVFIADRSDGPTDNQKCDKNVKDNSFEDFIDSLLGGGDKVVQVAEQRPTTGSLREDGKPNPPKRPKPPAQPKNPASIAPFQGRRRSTLTEKKSCKLKEDVPNPFVAATPTSPRSKKEVQLFHPPTTRPIRRGSKILVKKESAVSVAIPEKPNTTFTPKAPTGLQQKKCELTMTKNEEIAVKIDSSRDPSITNKRYNLADQIRSLTISADFEDNNQLRAVSGIDIETLFISTGPIIPSESERAVRIKQ